MEKNPYIELAECLLPEEMVEYFEVVKVEKTAETLDVTLEERDNGVDGYEAGQLRPNGFYDESVVRDYPVRGRKMSFHVRLNFYDNRSTNASAESINSKIKAFRAKLHGVNDTKFFIFRLCNIYA